MAPPPDPAQALLAHADFVHRLAAALLGEAGADVAQQGFVQALRSPPRALTRRFWTTTVERLVANAVRGERRRRFHETRLVQQNGEAVGLSPQQILEREEQRRRLIAAVLSLDEPFRQAVLLRYYEGIEPTQIAARLGVPAATVRTRLQRGLARLRVRLARDHGGRSAWAPLLAALGIRAEAVIKVMTMKKVLALIAAAILFACLLWFGPWTQAPSPSEPATVAKVQVGAIEQPVSEAPAAVVRERVDVRLRVEVVDEQGHAVAGAVARTGRALAPWLPEGESRNLGTTGEDGTLEVPEGHLQDLQPERDALYLHHPAHLAEGVAADAVLGALAARQPVRVALRRGFTQTFLFRTRTGEPVPGQTVVVGTTETVQDFTAAPPGHAGTTFEAVHRATSDARGEATVTGLPAGACCFYVAVDPLLGVVEGPRAGEGFQVPGPPKTLTVDWLLGGGVVVRGDRVVTGSARFYSRQLGSSFSQPLEGMLGLLRDACPELRTDAAPLGWVGFSHDRYPPIVRWQVLLARTGWHSGETRLQPLRDGFVPHVLTITPEHADAPMGEVLVTWPAHLPPLPFQLWSQPRSGELVVVTVEPGRAARVPPGKYELQPDLGTSPPFLFPARTIQVAASETVRIEASLPENVALCEAVVTFPSGRVPPRSTLQWQQYEQKGSYQLRPSRSTLVLLPTGAVDLTLHARGCEKSHERVEVGPNDRVTEIRLILRAAQ